MPSLLYRLTRRPLGAAMLLLLIAAPPCFAKTEYDIKAAYLYNFIKFISWPLELAQAPLSVCLFGKDPINEKLMPLRDVRLHNREIEVKTLDTTADATQCTVIYVAAERKKQVTDLVEQIAASPVLLVSDIEDFAKQGGTIGFVTLGNVIRFDVNLNTARSSGIAVSSKLLELANEVVQ